MNEEFITVKVNLTENNVCDSIMESTKGQRLINNLRMIFVPLIIFVPMIVLLWSADEIKSIDSISIFGCIVFAIIAVVAFVDAVRYKKGIKKLYKSDKLIQQEHIYTIKPDGLECKSAIGFWNFKWCDLYAFHETDKNFLIFSSHTQCYMIPKEGFENDDKKIEKAKSYFSNLPLYKGKNPAFVRWDLKRLKLIIGILIITVLIVSIVMLVLER